MDLVALSLSTTTAQSGRSIAVLQRNKCKMWQTNCSKNHKVNPRCQMLQVSKECKTSILFLAKTGFCSEDRSVLCWRTPFAHSMCSREVYAPKVRSRKHECIHMHSVYLFIYACFKNVPFLKSPKS
jgi:hypothetical protein